MTHVHPDRKVPHARWEVGSDLCWTDRLKPGKGFRTAWGEHGRYYGSGRDALRGILAHGMKSLGWKQLWVPSYFCQEVIASMLTTGVSVKTYRSNPFNPGYIPLGQLKAGDVAFVVDYYGMVPSAQNLVDVEAAVELIEDHSHDLASRWAEKSNADWCIASLRKTIPTPDGGVLWSPRRHKLPESPPPTPEHLLAAQHKQKALTMKSKYLEGRLADKSSYRQYSKEAEQNMSSGPISGPSPWVETLVKVAPVGTWRTIRRSNYRILADALGTIPWVRVIDNGLRDGASPFAMIMLCETPTQAKIVRRDLLQSNIYVHTLWPLSSPRIHGIDQEDIALSERLLVVHCDARYRAEDMMEIAEALTRIGRSFAGNGRSLFSNEGSTHL